MPDRIALLLDLSYQTYRAAAAHKGLTCGETFTGGLYGFLGTTAKMIRETAATHVWGMADSKPYKRSLIYPEYKQLRKKNADPELLAAFNESTPLVLEALKVLGIPVVSVPGFESDDCVASLVQAHHMRFKAMIAASNDSDLYQLLEYPHFQILRGSDRGSIVTRADLETGPMAMTPREFMLAQALQGTHNDVAGIPKVGPTTAYKIVKTPGLLRQAQERYGDLIQRNLMLSELPHHEMPRLATPTMGTYNPRDLYRFCARFDIEVTKSMVDSFEQLAHG